MRTWILPLIAGGVFLVVSRAEAVPVFSRATGMGCPACHQAWPVLNDFGELYRDRGYRVRGLPEEPVARSLDFAPFTFRTTVGYQYMSTTNQDTDNGKQTIASGAFIAPEADLIVGENISEHTSALAIISGFGADGLASIEAAFVRLNEIGGSSWLNLRVGKFELDLAASEHRAFTLTMPYLIYHYHPAGSANGFSIGDNQIGVELMGHPDGYGLRYVLSLFSSNAGAGSALDSPVVFGHLTYTFPLLSSLVPLLRVGVLGSVNAWPTTFATLTPATPGSAPQPIPGTGSNLKNSFVLGVEARATFLSIAHPLTVTAFGLYGQDDQALVEGATQTPSWHGGFLEASYTPTLEFTLFGRADAVWNRNQPTPDNPTTLGDQLAYTIGARYAVWLSAWGSVVGHIEFSTVNTRGATADDDTRVTTFLVGLDLNI